MTTELLSRVEVWIESLTSLHTDVRQEQGEILTAIREALAEPVKPKECAKGCPENTVCNYCQRAEPVKQEPVAWFKHGPYEDGEELICVFQDPQDDVCYSPLYAAPVDAKAIRAEALEEAAKVAAGYNAGRYVCECEGWSPDEVVKYPGCDYCNDELFSGRKCKCCGKVFIENVEQEIDDLRQQNAALKAVVDAWNNVEPVKQEPVGEVVLENMGISDAQIVRLQMFGRIPPVGTKLYAAPAQTIQHSEEYWLHEINMARADGYEKGRASCKHDERMRELGLLAEIAKPKVIVEDRPWGMGKTVHCSACGEKFMSAHRARWHCESECKALADHSGDANEMVSEPLQEPVSILDDPAFSVDVEYFEARKQALLNVAAKCDARRWIYLNRLNDMYFMPCENKDEPTNRVVFETTPDEAYDIGFSDGLEVGRKQRGEG